MQQILDIFGLIGVGQDFLITGIVDLNVSGQDIVINKSEEGFLDHFAEWGMETEEIDVRGVHAGFALLVLLFLQ